MNDKALRNYILEEKNSDIFGLTREQYAQCSWGLFIPKTLDGVSLTASEALSILNLYSPYFLYPAFLVNDMGIVKQTHHKDPSMYFHTQNASIFQTKDFVTFYTFLFDQAKYGSWHLDRIQSWNKEDWRLFVASSLYAGLSDYENSKSSLGWQRESAEMATILEALFTADDSRNEEVIYRLCKRIAVLLSWQFPNIERDIKKELYKARSDFVHGSYFLQIAKESPGAFNNIPSPDFKLLYKHKEYVRFALAACLNLAKVVDSWSIEGVKSVMDLLERAIIDIGLRERVTTETEALFALMPKPDYELYGK